jgi:polyferredoxin
LLSVFTREAPMVERVLADLVVAVHFGYVLFVVAGQVLILAGAMARWEWIRNRWFRGAHLAMIVIVVLEAWCGVVCPLTTWEQALRSRAGQSSYRGDFLPNLLHNLMFFDAPAWVFTLLYTLFGGLVLGSLLLAPPRWRGKA